MYGLMKAHVCSRHQEEAQQYRLHYCGVCKSMGRMYGQKSRLLLNNDAVFLAELLTALAPRAQAPAEWSRAYQSYNCFTLPESAAEMPLSLQVAGTATLLMTEFKVADQITDGGNSGWKFAQKMLAAEFERTIGQMETWGFPLEELRRWGAMQDERELTARALFITTPIKDILAHVVEPTAMVTGLVFQHSGATVGCDLTIQQRLHTLGKAFGTLVYVLDAYEDYSKDGRRGDFNAFQVAFGLSAKPSYANLPDCCHLLALAHMRELCQRVETELRALPLLPVQLRKFVTRLRSNLSERLGEEIALTEGTIAEKLRTEEKNGGMAKAENPRIVKVGTAGSACVTPATRPTLATQWQTAMRVADTLTQRHRQQQTTPLFAALTTPGVFCSVLAIALFFPSQTKTAASYQECRDIACNLIFLGTALRGLTRAPLRLLPSFASALPFSLSPAFAGSGGTAAGVLQSKEAESSGSGSSLTHSSSNSSAVTVRKTRRRNPCCGDAVCCDGCCDGCDCCCCACEGAECCSAGECCTACS